MNLKENTLYHLFACDRAKTKASRNYHYAIYTWQKGSKEFVSDKDKVKLWNKLKKNIWRWKMQLRKFVRWNYA